MGLYLDRHHSCLFLCFFSLKVKVCATSVTPLVHKVGLTLDTKPVPELLTVIDISCEIPRPARTQKDTVTSV